MLALLATVAFADSAVIYEFPDGRTVAVMATEEISMMAESVLITPSGKMYRQFSRLPLMDVWCVFHLVNLTDEPIEATVGFPLDANFGDAYSVFPPWMLVEMSDSMHVEENRMPWDHVGPNDGDDAYELIPAELEFTAKADGEPLEVSYRTCAWSLEDGLVQKPVMAVWRMRFAPGDTVRLENTYTTSWDYFGFGPDAWFDLEYIVTTGASWSGPIGYALIRMTIPDEFPAPGLSDTVCAGWWWSGSPAVDFDRRTVTWEYHDWEPDENMHLTICTLEDGGFAWEGVNAAALAAAAAWTPESLLNSTAAYLWENPGWTFVFHEELLVHILENVVALAQDRIPPWPEIAGHMWMSPGSWTAPPNAVAALAAVRREFDDNLELVREEDLMQFLPMIRFREGWTEEDLDMFAAMPESEDRFLRIMKALPVLASGEPSGDPAVDALYRLSGLAHCRVKPQWDSFTSEQVEAYRSGR